MKIFLFALILAIFGCLNSYGQKDVTFDFRNPKIPPVQYLKAKKLLTLTFLNLNPYLYEVTINDTLITYPNQKPDGFDALFKMPSLTNVASAKETSKNAKASALPKNASKALVEATSKETETDKDLEVILGQYPGDEIAATDVLKCSTVPSELEKILINCYLSDTELKSKTNSYLSTMVSGIDPDNLPINIVSQTDDNVSTVITTLEKLRKKAEDLKKKYVAVLSDTDKKMPLGEYRILETSVKKKTDEVDKITDNIKKLLDKLNELKTAKIGDKILEAYNKVMTARITKVVTKYANYGTDEILIKVNIKKKQDVACYPEVTSFNLNAVVTNGIKIDFSTGAVLNFGREKFFDQSYRKDPYYRAGNVLSDSIVIKRNRNNNVLMPSLGVFMHVYTRTEGGFKFGGLIGASTGTDQRFYTHLGGSILLGKSDRIILTGGVSVAKANILNGIYSEGQIVKKADAPEIIPVEEATRVGAFFSVSWNLNLIP